MEIREKQSGQEELYELFKVHLHKRLKEKINASIYVSINNDTLFIRISKLGIYWEKRYSNILDKILQEADSAKFADDIVKYFRREVLHTFFY